MEDIKQMTCYRPNFKSSEDPSNGNRNKKIGTQKTSSPKEMRLVAFLVICEKPQSSMK